MKLDNRVLRKDRPIHVRQIFITRKKHRICVKKTEGVAVRAIKVNTEWSGLHFSLNVVSVLTSSAMGCGGACSWLRVVGKPLGR